MIIQKQMKKAYKQIVKMCILCTFLLFISYSYIYAKTIDINGVNVTLNVEVSKETIGKGFNVNETKSYSEEEYDEDDKKANDKNVKVSLSLKNTNPYESADITVVEKSLKNFKQVGTDKVEKTLKLKLASKESKEYKYTYKYSKRFLIDQFNSLFNKDKEKIDNDYDSVNIKDIERKKSNLNDNDSKIISDNESKNKRKSSNIVLIVVIAIIVAILVAIAYYLFLRKLKDIDKNESDTSFFSGLNVFIISLVLSMVISLCFKQNLVYASNYEITIYEPGVSHIKNIKEIVSYNGRNYEFSYEITVKFENKNVIEDFDTDSDGDLLSDAMEYLYMTDKENADTDGDGLSDYMEVMKFNYNPKSKWTYNDGRNDGYRDYDGDGIRNIKELEYGTDPILYDTDGDNLSDYDEIFVYETNPLDVDTDGDSLNDDVEIKLGLDPKNPYTDGSTPDGEKKVKQEYSLNRITEKLKTGMFPIRKIESTTNGVLDEALTIKEYKDENLYASELLIGNSISIDFDSLHSDEKVRINIDYANYGDRIKKLTFVKYENGLMEAVDTKVDGTSLIAELGSGNYGVVDAEQYLRKLTIYNGDYN